MSTVVLIQASPRLVSTGAISDFRLAGGGSGPYFHLGFADWRAGVTAAPRFSTALGFDQSGWTGGALPQTGALRFFPSDKALMSAMAGYSWDRAPITITTADDEAVPIVYKTAFVGTVAALSAAGGALTATIADLSVDLDKPVLTDTFAGSGGIEGGDDAVGRIKRRTWGVVFNVEGRLLDKAYSIYEFSDPARPLQAFPMVKDKGREAGGYVDVPWQGSVGATLTALRNASAPTGGCARAPSIACVKWWTTPAGPLTADIEGEVGAGYVGAPIAIAARLATTFSTRITVDATSKAAAETYAVGTARAGVHVDETTETVGNLLDRLLLPVSFAWILSASGVMLFRRLAWIAATTSLRAETIERETTFKPLRTRTLGYQRNYRQHSDAEISVVLTEGIPVVIQWSPSATGPWHDGDFVAGDMYYRQSTNGGTSYGAAIKGVAVDGSPGAPGANGVTVQLFQRAASAPATPSANVTYTFATSGVSGVNNGWTVGIPAGTNPVWQTAAAISSTSGTTTIAPNQWASPVQAYANGATGASGTNNKSVSIYQRAATAPTLPSANSTYTFSTATLAGLNNGWSATIPAFNPAAPLPIWTASASALSPTDVDNINPGEWSAAQILADNGKNGASAFTLIAGGFASVDGNVLVNNHKPGDPGYGQWGYAGGRSREGWKSGAQASFKLEVGTAAGLSLDPTINENYPSINHSFRADPNGNTYMRSDGSETLIGLNNGNRNFQIIYDNAVLRLYINETVVAEYPASPDLTFYFDAAMVNGPGNRVYDIAFSAAGRKGDAAPAITISPATSQLRVGSNGAYIAGQSVSLNVSRANMPGTPVFTRSDGYSNTAAGYASVDPSNYSTSDTDNLTLANPGTIMNALGGAAGRFAFTASVPGFPQSATAEVKKIIDGKDGANGASNSSATSFGGTPGTLVPPGATVTLETSVQVVNNGTSGQFRVELYRQMQGGGSVVVNGVTQTIAAGGDYTFNVSGTYTNNTAANVFLQGAAFAYRVSDQSNVGGQGYVRIY